MHKLILALAFAFITSPVMAQNTTCSDRPSTDSSNACANTRFVQGHVTPPGGANGSIQYNNNGSFGGLSQVDVPRGGTGVASFTANVPILGNGASPIFSGARTGNTTTYTTASGPTTSGSCLQYDASGNIVATGSSCAASVTLPWIDIRNYANMAAAYAAIPAGGGTVVVPANYTETFSSSLTMNKPSAGFLFLGTATINMGTNQIVIPAGTNGAFIHGIAASSDVHSATAGQGLRFVYTGTGAAFTGGATVTRTAWISFENFSVDLSGAGTGATGFDFTNEQFCEFNRIGINASGAPSSGMRGIVFRGGPGVNDFTGYCRIQDINISGATFGILTTDQTNDNVMIGGVITASQIAGIYGIYRQGGGGFNVYNTELGSLGTAIFLDVNTSNDYYQFYGEANNIDFVSTAGSNNNYVNKSTTALSTVSDAGTGNVIVEAPNTRVAVTTVANLPTCNANRRGVTRMVSDSNAATFHTAVAGGGSNIVIVACNGTSWNIGG